MNGIYLYRLKKNILYIVELNTLLLSFFYINRKLKHEIKKIFAYINFF